MEILSLLCTQVPVIGALIWFLIYLSKTTERRFEQQSEEFRMNLKDVMQTHERSIEKICGRLDKIEEKINNK
jgi:hypothetical protein